MIPRKLPFVARAINRLFRFSDYELGYSQYLVRRIEAGEFRWLQHRNIKTILDIGANIGQFANMIHSIIPEASIYSFEPIEKCFKSLQMNTSHFPKIQCFCCAVGDKNATTVIHTNEFTPSSSLLKMADLHVKSFPYTRNTIEEEVQVRTLDSLLSQTPLEPNVLAKIDVQGFELNVLRGSQETLLKVDILLVETSFYRLYENQPLFDDVYQYLRSRGFSYRGNFDQVVSVTNGEVLQADAIFIREESIIQ